MQVDEIIVQDDSAKPKVGFLAPNFALKSLDGKVYKLSDYKGKVVFVNFWATWCPPCRKEVPSMVKLYNQYKDKGIEIIAISEDNDIKAVKKFIKEYNITFPVLIDDNKKAYNLYMATGVPETHLVNKRGIIERSVIGPFDWMDADVKYSLDNLLAAQ